MGGTKRGDIRYRKYEHPEVKDYRRSEVTGEKTEEKKKEKKEEDREEKKRREEFKIDGSELVDKIKELIHQGNIRRIILKNDAGETLIEIPLTLGLIGAALMPVLAAVGAIAALVARLTIVVEKVDE